MPNAIGTITNHDVLRMVELRAVGLTNAEIAVVVGCSAWTVGRYGGPSRRRAQITSAQRRRCEKLEARALRYAAFVDRAAAFAPLLVPQTPF